MEEEWGLCWLWRNLYHMPKCMCVPKQLNAMKGCYLE